MSLLLTMLAVGAARIVSIDHCADLHVLAFAEREQIAALSTGAEGDYAYLREAAKGLPKVAAEAEAVLAHRPTLLVRSYGGDARLLAHMERADVEVLEIGFPSAVHEIEANTQRIAEALGGETPALPSPELPPKGQTALYITPSGVAAGRGTLVSELLELAGYANHETRPGWHELPLERLVTDPPDMVVAGFFSSRNRYEGWWDAGRHPAAGRLLDGAARAEVPGDLLACAAFPMLEVPALIGGAP